MYSLNIMENGEHCTSTVHDSLVEAKIKNRLPMDTISTPKSFFISFTNAFFNTLSWTQTWGNGKTDCFKRYFLIENLFLRKL
jgi:hypothetical protein